MPRPRHDLPTAPFDVEADDMTQQFWGTSKGWVSSEQPTVRRRSGAAPARQRPDRPVSTGTAPAADDTTGSLRVIREGFAAFRPQTSLNATGEITRQRRHGEARHAVAPSGPPATHRHATHRHEATLAELAAGRADVGNPGEIDAEYDVPLTPVQPLAERLGLGAVDPLLLRAGAFLLALILLVPVVMSLRPDRDDSLPGDLVEAPQQVVAGAAPGPADTAPAEAVAASPTVEQPAVEQSAVEQSATSASTAAATAAGTPAAASVATATEAPADTVPATSVDEPTASAAERDAAAEVDVLAERVVPDCPQTYTAAAGDSWYRIAEAAGVSPQDLLAQNNATTGTVILPGDDICLPAGAAMPTPPTTVAPSTSTTPTTTEPAPTTTDTPATTAPSTTVAPVANLSPSEVQELIRRTWPADEVETALAVARRESNFVATADNGWCCVGVFQIYWTVHSGWLDDFGITERSDLFDARKNIAAAYAMWQRSGWGPWGG